MANSFVADRRLYLTAKYDDPDARVVEEGNPDAAFLLVGEGGIVDIQTAERFGLTAEQYGFVVEDTSDLSPGPFARGAVLAASPATDEPKSPTDPPDRAPADAAPKVTVEPSTTASKAQDRDEDKALGGPDSGAKK